MKSPADKKQNGMVAILDALGAANYSDPEIQSFLLSRENVLRLLDEKIEGVLGEINKTQIDIFTFNDTLLVAFKTDLHPPRLKQIVAFFKILRKFLIDSLKHKILFRGTISIGTFYVDKESSTVMGQAVTDAAAWYNKADWIGIHTTPKATITIQRWLENDDMNQDYLMLDYNVPLKDDKAICAKAVNWPKAFFVHSLTPCSEGEEPKEKLLQLLSEHTVPIGTEKKFFNTIAFFDHAVKDIRE
jgi:hypothetical protein